VDAETRELLAQVASMYYEEDLTQNEIAEALGLSRVKIYRLLRESRAKQIVTINIDWMVKRDQGLEQALQSAFGLKDARVLKSSHDHADQTLRQLGYLGARYLESQFHEISTMAICLGRATYEVINAIRPDMQVNVRIVQAIGSMPYPREAYDSSVLARQLAQKLGGQVMYLTSPLMADTAYAAGVIRSQRHIQQTLETASGAEIALLGIGNLEPASSGFVREGFLSAEELTAFSEDGAVGDLAWRVFDADGELYPCEFNERVIGISLDNLRQIPTTVAVASGASKANAILGALRTGAINVLCTDDKTATAVLRLIQG